MLAAAAGAANAAIAEALSVCVDTVRKWRAGSPSSRLAGLSDAPAQWPPTGVRPAVRAEVIALACALPAETGVPLSRWSCPELARELATRLPGRGLGVHGAPLAGRTTRSSPGSTGPGSPSATPTSRPRPPACWTCTPGSGTANRWAPNDYVICADEKTSIQARCRCHPTLPPGKARMMRVEHDYHRGGALAYLAAWDVHRGQVIGRCEATTGIDPFARLVDQVMTAEPYASADRVFWIVDNGSSHRGAGLDRTGCARPGPTRTWSTYPSTPPG